MVNETGCGRDLLLDSAKTTAEGNLVKSSNGVKMIKCPFPCGCASEHAELVKIGNLVNGPSPPDDVQAVRGVMDRWLTLNCRNNGLNLKDVSTRIMKVF